MPNLSNKLAHFCGTESYIRHRFGSLLFTDGIDFLRQEVDAFWLVDAIASHQSDKLDKACDGFQVWTLTKAPTPAKPKRVILACRRDTNTKALVEQEIEYTDFPFDEGEESFKLYVGGTGSPPKTGEVSGRVLMLPSEY